MTLIVAASLLAPIAAVGGFLALHRRRRLAPLRRLFEGPPTPIAEAQDGPVVIHGRVQAGETTRAPLSGEQVCGYRVRFVSHPYRRLDRVLLDRTRVKDLTVQDDSGGTAEVRAEGAVLLGDDDFFGSTRGLLTKEPPAEVTSYLEAFGHSTSLGMPQSLSWYEYQLKRGDPVLLVGEATRAGAPPRLTVQAPAGGRLVIVDKEHRELMSTLDDLDLPPGFHSPVEEDTEEDGA